MNEIRGLRHEQRLLLHAWLHAEDGALRFEILKRLRSVERRLGELAKQKRIAPERVPTYSIPCIDRSAGA